MGEKHINGTSHCKHVSTLCGSFWAQKSVYVSSFKVMYEWKQTVGLREYKIKSE